ncbi:hypothetical protein D3C72_1867450 [compost metagenome]
MDIHIINRDGIDAGGGHQPRVVTDSFHIPGKPIIFIEEGSSRIPPLHTAVKVIPMIDHPQSVYRIHSFIESFNLLQCADQAQQVKHSIENACRRGGSYSNAVMICTRADGEPFASHLADVRLIKHTADERISAPEGADGNR